MMEIEENDEGKSFEMRVAAGSRGLKKRLMY